MLIPMLMLMLMLFAASQWKEMSTHTHTHILLSMRLCLELLLLLLLLLLLMLRQMFCRRGRLIICTFCCKDLLSFYADKRYTHILKRGLASSTAFCICLSCFFCFFCLFMDMNVNLSQREKEREKRRHLLKQCNEMKSFRSLIWLFIIISL